MSNVLTFPGARLKRRRRKPELRVHVERAIEVSLDFADRMLAVLDRIDGDPDREDGGDVEPSLCAPDGHASQVGWLRGSDSDREEDRPPPHGDRDPVRPA